MANIAQQLVNLSKVDFSAIQSVEDKIATDRTAALAFVSDPDGYMKQALRGTFLPPELHFHVRDEAALFPAEVEIPESQIAITTTIKLDPAIKAEVLAKLASLLVGKDDVIRKLCDGCKECKIAILR